MQENESRILAISKKFNLDTIKSIKHAINFLKKDGILILGLGETNGFFQRNLQRYILYSLSRDKNELIKYNFEKNR